MPIETKISPKKTSALTILLVIAGGLLLLNVLFIVFAQNETKTLALLKNEVRVLEQQNKIIAGSATIYSTYENEIESISAVFPSEETFPIFLQTMEETIRLTTNEYAVKIASDVPLKEGDRLFLPLVITLKVNHTGLVALLDKFETIPYMLHVLSISAKNPDGFLGVSEISISLKVYVQNPFTTQSQ